MQLSLDGFSRWGIASVHPATRPGEPPQADARANGMTFSDNGRWLVTSHNDGSLHVHNGESGSRQATFLSREYGCKFVSATHHEHCVLHASHGAKGDSPAGGQVAYHSLYDNKVVRFFRSGTPASVTSISVCPLSDWFIATYTDGTFRLWDLRTPNCQASGVIEPGEGSVASFDCEGRCFAVATPGRGVALYDVKDFQKPSFDSARLQLLEYTVRPEPMPGRPTPPRYPARVAWSSVDFSPDERFIALGTADRGVLIVDAFHLNREYALLAEHPIDPASPAGVSWSPDGRFLAVGGADGHAYVYDLDGSDKFGREGAVPGGLPQTGNANPNIKGLPNAGVLPYNPVTWSPPFRILGEAHKTEAARSSARSAAAMHRQVLWQSMHSAQQQDAIAAGPAGMMQPPPARPVPSIPGPFAASEAEQVSRLEGQVRALRFHPKAAVLASASSAVAMWTAT